MLREQVTPIVESVFLAVEAAQLNITRRQDELDQMAASQKILVNTLNEREAHLLKSDNEREQLWIAKCVERERVLTNREAAIDSIRQIASQRKATIEKLEENQKQLVAQKRTAEMLAREETKNREIVEQSLVRVISEKKALRMDLESAHRDLDAARSELGSLLNNSADELEQSVLGDQPIEQLATA